MQENMPAGCTGPVILDPENIFGETFRFHRERCGLTQGQCGARLEPFRTDSFISQVETNKKGQPPFTASMLCRAAQVLEVDPQSLFIPFIQQFGTLTLDFPERKDPYVRALSDITAMFYLSPGISVLMLDEWKWRDVKNICREKNNPDLRLSGPGQGGGSADRQRSISHF